MKKIEVKTQMPIEATETQDTEQEYDIELEEDDSLPLYLLFRRR